MAARTPMPPDRIASYFRQEKGPLALVTVTGLLYNVGMTAGPWFEGQLAQRLLDIMAGRRTLRDMVLLAAVYVLVILLVQGTRCVKRFYVRRFANDTARSMKQVLYRNLVRLPRQAVEQEGAGSLMTNAISDADACAEGMRKFTTETFDTGVVMIAYLVMLLSYDWRLALLSCLFPPLAYVLAGRLKKAVYRCSKAYRENAGRLNAATLDRVGGALTYRVFGGEARRDAAYESCLRDYSWAAVRASLWETATQPVYQVLSMGSVVFILWLGGRNVQGVGTAAWNIAAFTTFLSCFTKLAVKSSKAAKLFNAVQKAQVSWGRIRPLMRAVPEEDAPITPPAAPLTVEALSAAYPGGQPVFSGVSFRAQPGTWVGVTGPVGCGKSTLGKAFLEEMPVTGSILLGDTPLCALPKAARRGAVAYLGHQPELLSDTVAENIRLGGDRPVAPLLRAVCMEDEVAAMEQGENTPVGTGGSRLSGGQQARLALARTLYAPRPVTILDDPFSAVDRPTEAQIFSNLRPLLSDSVTLLISHRLELFPRLEQVIWLENGRAQVGTHASLMAENPAYARLYRMQTEGGDGHEAAR